MTTIALAAVQCLLLALILAAQVAVWMRLGRRQSTGEGSFSVHPAPQGPPYQPSAAVARDWLGRLPAKVTEDKGEQARMEARKQAELEAAALLARGFPVDEL